MTALIVKLRQIVAYFLAWRWVRFGIVGCTAAACYVLLGLFFVNLLKLPMLLGNGTAYVLSFIVSYLGQSRWTFETRGSHASMLPRFAATQAFGLALNSFIIYCLTQAGLAYELAMPIAIFIVPIAVYLLCKFWVFRQKRQFGGNA